MPARHVGHLAQGLPTLRYVVQPSALVTVVRAGRGTGVAAEAQMAVGKVHVRYREHRSSRVTVLL